MQVVVETALSLMATEVEFSHVSALIRRLRDDDTVGMCLWCLVCSLLLR